MRGRCLFLMIAGCLALVQSVSAIRLTFVNQNPRYADTNIFVLFYKAGTTTFTASYAGGHLAPTTSYSLAQIGAEGIDMHYVNGGICYIALGHSLTNGRAGEPSPYDPNDLDYHTRWDRFELTVFSNAFDTADMTSINLIAVPLKLTSYAGVTPLASMINTYIAWPGFVELLLSAATNQSALLKDGEGRTLRVLGPTAYPSGHIGPYRPLDDYVTHIRTQGFTNTVHDLFVATGSSSNTMQQLYTFSVTNAANGDVTLRGGGEHVGYSHTIVLTFTDLAYHVYASDPHYTVDGHPNSFASNDVYAAAVRDVLAGYAAGFFGSTITDAVTGVRFKDESTDHWFATNQTRAFSDVQPEHPYYNKYGETFWRHSDSYGFPFADRLRKKVQINLNPTAVDRLEIVILPDEELFGWGAPHQENGLLILPWTGTSGSTYRLLRGTNLVNNAPFSEIDQRVLSGVAGTWTQTTSEVSAFYQMTEESAPP